MLEIRHSFLREGTSTREAYNRLYRERALLMRDSFYLWLIDLLRPEPGAILLDISCGQGRLVQLAAERNLTAVGTDFSIQGLLKGAEGESSALWVVGDGEQLPLPEDSIDYIMHIGSLEHYENPLRGAREIARVLSPRGKACVLVPNSFGLLGNVRCVWETGEIFDDGQPLQRYATRRSWEVLLENGGLVVEQLIPFGEVNAPRTVADLLWTCARPQKLVRALLAALTPVNLANHFVFLCRAADEPVRRRPYPMLPAYSW